MMEDHSTASILIQRATERLRQEQETFEQLKSHDTWWFSLQLVMGFTSVLVFVGILLAAVWVLLIEPQDYSDALKGGALGALFGDGMATVVSTWRVFLSRQSAGELQPTTDSNLNDGAAKGEN